MYSTTRQIFFRLRRASIAIWRILSSSIICSTTGASSGTVLYIKSPIIPPTMSSSTSSTYLSSFAMFKPNASASLEDEFARLAVERHWAPHSKKYKTERRKFLISEYNEHVGYVEVKNKLYHWQELCREVGIRIPPPSITQCRKVLSKLLC